MVCCAKCQFPPFLPASSITMPPSWKILSVDKTPTNSTLRAYHLILPVYDTIQSHFFIIEQKFENGRSKSIGQNRICSMLRITHIAFFGKPYLHRSVNTIYIIHPITVNLISPTIHIIPTTISQDPMIFNTIISIFTYCYYYATYCNSIIYSYIYQYNLSIKIYNNQYRYKHTD